MTYEDASESSESPPALSPLIFPSPYSEKDSSTPSFSSLLPIFGSTPRLETKVKM